MHIFRVQSRKVYIDSTLKQIGIISASPFCTFMVSVIYRLFVNVVELDNSEQFEIEGYTHKYFGKLLNEL